MLARGVLGTEAVGLGPEELFRPLSSIRTTPTPASSTRRSSCSCAVGATCATSMSMLVPEAWEGVARPRPRRARLLPVPRVLTEPWDGPAGLDLHRRPSRRRRARPQRAAPAALAAQRRRARRVLLRGRRGPAHGPRARHAWPARPGRDAVRRPRRAGGLRAWQDDDTVKRWLAGRAPVRRLGARRPAAVRLPATPIDMPPAPDELVAEQVAFGCNREEVAMVLKPMATDAKEPTFSMGDDTPFAARRRRGRGRCSTSSSSASRRSATRRSTTSASAW